MDIYSALMQNACIESGYDNINSILSTAHIKLIILHQVSHSYTHTSNNRKVCCCVVLAAEHYYGVNLLEVVYFYHNKLVDTMAFCSQTKK